MSRSSSNKSAYVSSVKTAEAWPNCRCTTFTFAPAETNRPAATWRRRAGSSKRSRTISPKLSAGQLHEIRAFQKLGAMFQCSKPMTPTSLHVFAGSDGIAAANLSQPVRILVFNQQTRDANALAKKLHSTLSSAVTSSMHQELKTYVNTCLQTT